MTNSSNPLHSSEVQNNKRPVIDEINDLITKIGQRLTEEDDQEQQWMVDHCDNPQVAALLPELTVGMLHVLDAIGRLEPVNGITVSKQFGIPKGSVSKVTRKLVAKKLVVTETIPNNKKEILFRITPLGKAVFDVHRAMHQEMEQRTTEFLQRYTDEELKFIARIIQDFSQARWLNQEKLE